MPSAPNNFESLPSASAPLPAYRGSAPPSKLQELLSALDEAVTNAEQCKTDADVAAVAAARTQLEHEKAVQAVVDLQYQLRERLGAVVGGGDSRVRQSG